MRIERAWKVAAAALAASVLTLPAGATVLDDFNASTLITDFQFDDAANTPVENALNSAGAGFDSDADMNGVVTNGAGQLDLSGKANTLFGSLYSDVAGVSTGRVIGLTVFSWAFDESVFDPAQDEEFRLSLINFDPRSTFVTAESFLRRSAADEVILLANAVGTGSSDTPETVFGSSGSLMVFLDVDLDADTVELLYSEDGGATIVSGGTGALDPTRGVESVRLVVNEDFSDDRFLVDRFAVGVAMAPVPLPAALPLLAGGLGVLAYAGRRRAKAV